LFSCSSSSGSSLEKVKDKSLGSRSAFRRGNNNNNDVKKWCIPFFQACLRKEIENHDVVQEKTTIFSHKKREIN